MISAIKQLLGFGPKINFASLVKDGAQIIDVRTKDEYKQGHIKGSVNIPLHILKNHLNKIKKDLPVITCCASGIRSASAKSILKANGYTNVHNGGGWIGLHNKTKQV
jgi:rhodanese-related sulfurtransferase